MGEWYLYDWDILGEPTRFYVDLGCMELFKEKSDYSILMYVTCDSRVQDASCFTAREERRLKAVLRDCQHTLRDTAIFVGMLDVGARRQFFFYANDARDLVQLYDLCKREKLFAMSCGKEDEPTQSTYRNILYPDQAKRQSVRNIQYAEALEDRGDDIQAPRRVNLHFYFPSDQMRFRFSLEAKQAGFALGRTDFIAERELAYYIVLHTVSTLQPADLTKLTTKAIDVAELYSGEIDHVDSAFVSRYRPKR